MKRQTFFLILLLFFTHAIQAQRVVLVFSGGGAKGLSYIGALKALEENGIPIDGIIGTSIGGLVGGFYAAGYSPQEMEALVVSDRFQNWAAGRLEEEDKISIYQKLLDDPVMVNFRIGLDTTYTTNFKTKSLINDDNLRLGLMESLFMASCAAKQNFDSLVIPFRCVAAEIFTQSDVVLSKGNLNEALRATMAVPLFFTPQKIDNQYLFDGGLYDNFPVKKAKQIFKPDVVIGFNVSDKIFSEYPYTNDEQLIDSKMITYLLLSKSDTADLDPSDVFVHPNVNTFSSTDFTRAKELIDIGYQETMSKMHLIKNKILKREDSLYYDERREEFKYKFKKAKITSSTVDGFKGSNELNRNFKYNRSKELDFNAIHNGYFNISQSGAYDRIRPNLHYNDSTGAYQFSLDLKHNKDLKIGIGGCISNKPISYLFVSFEKDVFRKRRYSFYTNGYVGIFYLSNLTWARMYFSSFRPMYIEPSFTYNRWDFYQNSNLLDLGKEKGSFLTQNEMNMKLKYKTAIQKKGSFSVSGAYINTQARYSILSSVQLKDTLSHSQLKMFQAKMEYVYNKLNKIQYPSVGQYLHIDFNYYTGTEYYEPGSLEKVVAFGLNPNMTVTNHKAPRSWFALQLKAAKYFRIRNRYTLGFSTQEYFSNQELFFNHKTTAFYTKAYSPIMDSYTLYYEDFRSPNFVSAGLTNSFYFTKNLEARCEVYSFYNLTPIRFNGPAGGVGVDNQYYSSTPEMSFIGAAGFVYHFFLGPIALQATYYDTEVLGTSKFGFVLHAGFLLKNKRWDD